MKHLEGDTRSREQREYDAAVELLLIDADQGPGGGVSARPTTGLDGHPVDLVVRGAHVAVLIPYSVTQGGNLELAEIPGLGYVLPSTARELLEHADKITRVAVDADTGEVLAVDDAVAGPGRRRRSATARHAAADTPAPLSTEAVGESGDDTPDEWPDGSPGGGTDRDPRDRPPSPGGLAARPIADRHCSEESASDLDAATSAAVQAAFARLRELPPDKPPPDLGYDPSAVALSSATRELLRDLASRKVIWRDLNSSAYRVPGRLRRAIEHRDRTCTYPGCTVPGYYCDIDHREEFPRGGTHAGNCHALCRRHHRAKQFYFAAVTLDPTTGDTCWTTYEGSTCRRPPRRY
jgi:hypothetical protein